MSAVLTSQTWDLVTSDYSMPHLSGVTALELLKQSGLDLPFIIISGAIGEDMAVAAMKAGAHDYLMKGNLRRLNSAIERELREAELRAQRRQTEETLHNVGECTGIGIGLSSVQRVVHRHARQLWAKGKVEKGAAFYLTLSPFASAASGKNEAALQSSLEVGL